MIIFLQQYTVVTNDLEGVAKRARTFMQHCHR